MFAVHALYPQSTCFYKAKVNQVPQNSSDAYELLFDDDTYESGYSEPMHVPQRYVIAYKNTKKSSGTSS